jgi:hypothetical protein
LQGTDRLLPVWGRFVVPLIDQDQIGVP